VDDDLRALEQALQQDPGDAELWERYVAALVRSGDLRAVLERQRWEQLPPASRQVVASHLAERLGEEFELAGLESHAEGPELAVLRHAPSGVRFTLIPGGSFLMGLSEDDEQALRDAIREESRVWYEDELSEEDFAAMDEAEMGDSSYVLQQVDTMRPTREVRVPPFLLARAPLTIDQARTWVPEADVDYRPGGPIVGTLGVRLTPEQLERALSASGWRAPSEAEWEYAARAGTTTLTPWGPGAPSEDRLVWEFDEEQPLERSRFGLAGLGSYLERCADAWHPSYEDAPADASPWLGEGPAVHRGGAIDCSPWQACGEWTLLLPMYRQGGASALGAALRPALDLPV